MTRSASNRGQIIVYTGSGKGKTTAALGLALRAWGRGLQVAVVQFIKSDTGCGEHLAAAKLGIPIYTSGDGFTWASKDIDETIRRARDGWKKARSLILSGALDVLILDEFTYPLHYGWLDSGDVLTWLQQNRPPHLHLVITGRNAPPALIEAADLVTEMLEIKHPLKDQGIPAQPGIDY